MFYLGNSLEINSSISINIYILNCKLVNKWKSRFLLLLLLIANYLINNYLNIVVIKKSFKKSLA